MSLHFDAYVGSAAGVATSLLWTATSLLFTAAGKRIGVTIVNATRISFALVLLGLTHRLLAEQWIPDANARQVVYLALSGVVGLSIGDQALFTSFVHIGPRLAMLIMTTSPLFAAFFGWVILDETLSMVASIGIVMTIGGVAWVVLERPQGERRSATSYRTRGILFAFIAAACQAGGLLLSKQGMGHGWLGPDERLGPQAATLVRMVFAAVGMLPILLVRAGRGRKRRASGVLPTPAGSRWSGLTFACGGAVVGPFLGVWMSLVAADRAPVGVAQTLCSLAPIFLLPFAVVIHKERIGARAVVGAVIAVAGSVLLFVRPQ
jgi:drug/metabolite transporter (DMT)-like permease